MSISPWAWKNIQATPLSCFHRKQFFIMGFGLLRASEFFVFRKMEMPEIINHLLAHTKWMCKYHIVFTPKYRRKIIYNQYKESIRDILKQLCSYKGVEIIEGHLMPDHVHMLVSIPPKYSVSQFMGYLKGKSTLMIFDKHANHPFYGWS